MVKCQKEIRNGLPSRRTRDTLTHTSTRAHCHSAICPFVHAIVGFGSQVFRFLSLRFRFEVGDFYLSLLYLSLSVLFLFFFFSFIPIRFIMPHKCASQLCFHRLFRKSTHFWIYLRFTISSFSPPFSVSLSHSPKFTRSLILLSLGI